MGGYGGTHSRTQACAYLCAALQEVPPSAPGPTQGASLACPCPTHLASLAAATVTQGRSSSHQTGLRGEVSQLNLHGWGVPSGAKIGPHCLPETSGGRETTPPELTLFFPQDPSRLRLHDYVPFVKGSGQARALSPGRLRESEPEKRHGGQFGAGPPHSPKLKVRGPSAPTSGLTT